MVKPIRATVRNGGVADLRGATPKTGGGAVVANNEAVQVTDINADRQQVQQAVGEIQDAFVQESL
jgi:hypothetical protein